MALTNHSSRTHCVGRLNSGVRPLKSSPMQADYSETVSCEASADEGLLFIKVVAMPHGDPVEFDVAQAKALAKRILAAVEVVEAGWVGKSVAPPGIGGA